MAQKYFTMGPDNVGTLLTTTQEHFVQHDLIDNFFNLTPMLRKLGDSKKMVAGGASIVVPLLIDENSTATWYELYDELDTTPQAGMTLAQAKWKNLATSVSIAGQEERQNSGQEKLISLLEAKDEQALLTMKRQLTAGIFAASTGAKKIESLVTMIDATSTIQEINSTNSSFWQSTVTTGGSFAAQGLSDMRTTWSTIGQLTPDVPLDLIVTTNTVKDFYEGSLTPQTRYSPGGTFEGAPVGLQFKTSTVFDDSQCTSGVMYMFPTKSLFLVVNSQANMAKTEFVKPSNQDARVSQLIIMLQLVTTSRRKLAKITGITA